VALLLLGLSAAGCPRAPEPPAPVVVGAVLPLTGPQASYGVAARSGLELAAQQVNAAGQVRLRLVVMDDEGDRELAVSAAQRLIARDRAALLIGEVSSSASLALAEVAQRAQVPLISPSATAPELTRMGPYVFRACAADPFQAQAMARFATGTLKARRFGVLVDLGSTYSPALAEAFRAAVGAAGGAVVAQGQYSADDPDFDAALDALRAAEVEAVYLPGYAREVRRILVAAKARGLAAVFLGGDGWDAPEVTGPEADGHYFVSHYAPEAAGPEAAGFAAAYQAAYNEAPDAYSALGYDTLKLAAAALAASGGASGEPLRAALAGVKGFSGITGKLAFNPDGDPAKPMVVLRLKGGAREVVETVAP
jgi:branched-chain amino acid transport system substrate-binding protein